MTNIISFEEALIKRLDKMRERLQYARRNGLNARYVEELTDNFLKLSKHQRTVRDYAISKTNSSNLHRL